MVINDKDCKTRLFANGWSKVSEKITYVETHNTLGISDVFLEDHLTSTPTIINIFPFF